MPAGRTLHARVWQAQVGRVPLLLLDSDIEANEPDLRNVTDRLYGGDQEHRLTQEILVGVGGVRAVRAYCAQTGHPEPDVFHTNEGHAGFLGLERIRELSAAHGLDVDQAVAAVRAGTVFTTHTPVPAGIDRFPVEMVRRYFTRSVAARRPGRAGARARRRGRPRPCSTWRTWGCASRSGRTGCPSCTARCPGPCSARSGPASTRARCRSAR